ILRDSIYVSVTPPPMVAIEATFLGAHLDWANGGQLRVEGRYAGGETVPLASVATVAQVGGESGLIAWEPAAGAVGTLRTGLPPFSFTGRRDVGVLARIAVSYQGLSDTVEVPLHYRRPVTMSWPIATPVSI